MSNRIKVRRAIELDSKFQLRTVKIEDEATDLVLTTELEIQEPAATENVPQQLLSRGLSSTE